MLVALLCSTILVPFSYANVENLWESGWILDNRGEVLENEWVILDDEDIVAYWDNKTIETEVGDSWNWEVPSLQSTLDHCQIESSEIWFSLTLGFSRWYLSPCDVDV